MRRLVQALLACALVVGCAPDDGGGGDAPTDALGSFDSGGALDATAVEPDGSLADSALDAHPGDAAPEGVACEVGEALLGQVDRTRLLAHLEALTGLTERKTWEAQARAAAYIVEHLEGLPNVELVEHGYEWSGQRWVNMEATWRGTVRPDRYLLAGAHDDSTSPDPALAPGADDDASGVATLLEVARVMSSCQPGESVRLLSFSNEEAGTVGSMAYAADLARTVPPEQIQGYLNLDMLAYGPDDEDLDVATRPAHEAFAEAVAVAVERWTALDVVRHIDEHCG